MLTLVSGCATTSKVGAAASVARTLVSSPASTGYDWGQVLPPPPVVGGPADQADMDAVRQAQSLEGTPRWAQATADASLQTFDMFRDIIGPDFTPAKRPEIVALMAYAGRQFIIASTESKALFARPRPFITAPDLKVCTAEKPTQFSYPSGHAGWGWMSAQILARVEPRHASALLARGRDYGQSRVVCAVHYPSDLVAGRYLGDAVFTHLDNDPQYLGLMASAKAAVK
jgi:acid phosphatase (class A)